MEERWMLASAWLWLMVFFNLLGMVFLVAAFTGSLHTTTPVLVQRYSFVASAIQIVCIAAIFRWHRWGWWGLLLVGLTTFLLNVLVLHRVVYALAGLAGVGLTFLLLKGGGRLAVWPRLQ